MNLFSYFLVFLITICAPLLSFSQQWEKVYPTDGNSRPLAFQQTSDQGFILLYGSSGTIIPSPPWAVDDLFLIKTDMNGDTLWTTSFPALLNEFKSVIQTRDGGYLLTGTDTLIGGGLLIKTDANGNPTWQQVLTAGHQGHNSIQLPDGGFAVATFQEFGPRRIRLFRLDSLGAMTWARDYPAGIPGITSSNGTRAVVRSTQNGGFVLASLWQNTISAGPQYLQVIRTNAMGDTLWRRFYPAVEGFYDIQPTPDGGFVTIGQKTGASTHYFQKIDSLGNREWLHNPNQLLPVPTLNTRFINVVAMPDGTFRLPGVAYDSLSAQMTLTAFDSAGIFMGGQLYGGQNYDHGFLCQLTSDGGFAILGSSGIMGPTSPGMDLYLVKTDSLGFTTTNLIEGYAFADANSDCLFDTTAGDYPLAGRIVRVDPGPLFCTTNDRGYYAIRVDTGTYTVQLPPATALWTQTCPAGPPNWTVNFPMFNDTVRNVNFGYEAVDSCPLLRVSTGVNLFRRCGSGLGGISWRNEGTATATNARVVLTLPPGMDLTTSSIPWTLPQSGGVYQFELGNLPPGTQGSLIFTDTLDCRYDLGAALCVKAHIYPDSSCFPVNPGWDGSHVTVTGTCTQDSIACFIIKNTSGSNMAGNSAYRVFEDNVLIRTVNFQLNAGDSLQVCDTANGHTFRLEADQRPFHPGQSQPRATVEACGTPPLYGFALQAPLDDPDPFIDVYCDAVRAPFDPNEKSVSPLGLTAQHYIPTQTEWLQYTVRFQNVGTDTAFRVVVRDTLSAFLNPASVIPGAASHPYRFRMYGPGIGEWTFTPIALPDSSTDLVGSQGFFSFQVRQTPGNPEGTRIENRVGIFFDYELPVITNTAFSTLLDTVLVLGQTPETGTTQTPVKVWPNPARDQVHILSPTADFQVELIDLQGRTTGVAHTEGTQLNLATGGFPAGIYLLRIRYGNGVAVWGKVVLTGGQ